MAQDLVGSIMFSSQAPVFPRPQSTQHARHGGSWSSMPSVLPGSQYGDDWGKETEAQDWETPCRLSPDNMHCVHWYDDEAPCCYCGNDPSMVGDRRDE